MGDSHEDGVNADQSKHRSYELKNRRRGSTSIHSVNDTILLDGHANLVPILVGKVAAANEAVSLWEAVANVDVQEQRRGDPNRRKLQFAPKPNLLRGSP